MSSPGLDVPSIHSLPTGSSYRLSAQFPHPRSAESFARLDAPSTNPLAAINATRLAVASTHAFPAGPPLGWLHSTHIHFLSYPPLGCIPSISAFQPGPRMTVPCSYTPPSISPGWLLSPHKHLLPRPPLSWMLPLHFLLDLPQGRPQPTNTHLPPLTRLGWKLASPMHPLKLVSLCIEAYPDKFPPSLLALSTYSFQSP